MICSRKWIPVIKSVKMVDLFPSGSTIFVPVLASTPRLIVDLWPPFQTFVSFKKIIPSISSGYYYSFTVRFKMNKYTFVFPFIHSILRAL